MENQNLDEFFDTLFSTEEEKEEAKQYSFGSEVDIDDSIEKVKELNAASDRLEQLYKDKIESLKLRKDAEVAKINRQKSWLEFNIKNAVMQSDDKGETKTMFKKKYLSGEVQIKKPQENLIKPELDVKIIEEKFSDYKKEETKVTLDWAALKKDLKVLNGKVYDKDGNDVSGLIGTEITAEKVVIK